MKTIHLICAARPNFMKIAPLYHQLKDEDWCSCQIIHTGQHYDYEMSQVFFEELRLPSPNYYLGVGSGTHAQQTANTMIAYEKLCQQTQMPDLVIVVGDVNATLACSIAAKKLHLKVAHLEAGLRCFDRSLPEEINRVVTDSISDYHWTPSLDANENLLKEGIHASQINFVGNIMIDAYCMMENQIAQRDLCKSLNVVSKNYVVLTLHRPANVDSTETIHLILDKIGKIEFPVFFPVHPRTQKKLALVESLPANLRLLDPLGYIDFMSLVLNSAFVISDSGGIQEETTYLGIPCFTLREATERPVTVTLGSNQLISVETLLEKITYLKKGSIPPLWDGQAAQRIKTVIQQLIQDQVNV